MTIAYPRSLPSVRITGVTFEPEPQEANSGEVRGRYVSTMLGPTLWNMAISTTPPTEREFSLWRAWLDSLDGAGHEFYGYDVRRPLPWAYRRTGFDALTRAVSNGAFNGTSSAWEMNDARDEITIGDAAGQELPLGFELMVGDYVGLQWTGNDTGKQRRSVHRINNDYNASAEGVSILGLRPHVAVDVPADAVVNFIKPSALFVVTKRDRNAEGKSRRVSFEAQQNLEFD